MAQVAKSDQWVEDVNGIERLVKGGAQVPVGMFHPGTVEVEEVSVRTLARPIVDEEASKSQAERTGDQSSVREPNAGVSFDHVDELTARSSSSSSRRGAKAPKSEG